MNQIRTFIALDFPSAILRSIEQQTQHLRQIFGEDFIRWVPTHNLHLTLKILGEYTGLASGFHQADACPSCRIDCSI